jgi:hypothetical protein
MSGMAGLYAPKAGRSKWQLQVALGLSALIGVLLLASAQRRPDMGLIAQRPSPVLPVIATAHSLERGLCGDAGPCISVHVFMYRRQESTRLLLDSLAAANYSGYTRPVPLVLHIDAAQATQKPLADQIAADVEEVCELARAFVWPHGPKVVDIKPTHVGLRGNWLTAWTDPGPHDMMIALEDDMVVSAQYFQWLVTLLRIYKLQEPGRDPSLLGISLSPVRVDEISPPCKHPFRRWMPHGHISGRFFTYVHGLPSSWGAAYFGAQWAAFLDFVIVRAGPPFYPAYEAPNAGSAGEPLGDRRLSLPDSCSNAWPRSWKRFMIDFAYGRGAYMLYPNVNGSAGLATSLHLAGEHTKGLANNPRIAHLVSSDRDWSAGIPWHPFTQLPMVDLRGHTITGVNMSRAGDAFVASLCALGEGVWPLVEAWRRPCLSGGPSVASCAAVAVPGDRYLVFQPQMGLNNQLRAIVNAAFWAHTLGRVLVVPHVFAPRVHQGAQQPPDEWTPFSAVFDPADLSSVLPGLRYVQADLRVMRQWRPSRVVVIEPDDTFGGDVGDWYLDALGWGGLPRVNLLAHTEGLRGADGLYSRLGSCSEPVLVVNGLYKAGPGIYLAPPRVLANAAYTDVWQRMLMPNVAVAQVVRRAMALLQGEGVSGDEPFAADGYGCMHLRFGDFAGYCTGSDPGTPDWLVAKRIRNGWQCVVSPESVRAAADAMVQPRLLVLSDDPARAAEYVRGIRQRVTTSADLAAMVRTALPTASETLVAVAAAAVDQRVCAGAQALMLNGYSTFSGGVVLYRGSIHGVAYWQEPGGVQE